jgi:TonB-linked SusC/RagA family outer membrane protein
MIRENRILSQQDPVPVEYIRIPIGEIHILSPKHDKTMHLKLCGKIPRRPRRLPSKIVKPMKLTALVMVLSALQISARGFSQDRISLHERNVPLEKVFQDIRSQSSYLFFYDVDVLRQAAPVTLQLKNAGIDQVLQACFKDQPLSYVISHDIIVVSLKNPTSSSPQPAPLPPVITGTVLDSATGTPLPGVTIRIRGESTGTVTDTRGHFSLDAPEGAVLEVSYVGYNTKQVVVGGRTSIQIRLSAASTGLSQLVVVGYGKVENKYLTGSVSTIDGNKLRDIPASGVNQVLGGRAAGVEVTNVNGAPGASSVIRVRGGNSIQGDNNPLYVVDGVIMGQDYNLNKLNISDIQSINVLKDATAVAIYGTRGSNGVVLITTKSGAGGEPGKTNISVSAYAGVQTFVNNIDFLNGPELAAYANEDAAYRSASLPFDDPNSVPNTDWIGLLTHSASVYNADASVSGLTSDGKLNYYVSGGYYNQDGIIKNSGFEKYSLTANLDLKLSSAVTMGMRTHVTYMHVNNNKINFNGGEASLLHGDIPVRAVYDSTGEFTAENPVTGTVQSNPMADNLMKTDYTNSTNILTSFYLQVTPMKGLVLKTTFSPVLDYTKHNVYNPGELPQNKIINAGGNGAVTMGTTVNMLNENTITYTPDIGPDNSLDLLGGFTWQTAQDEGVNAHGYAYFNDDETFNNLGAGSDPTRNEIGSDYNSYQLVSWLGRANYTYKHKYLLTLVARADGSSRFAPGNKYSFFPAAAIAWRLGQERFIRDLGIFDALKLKVSYGLSGSQSIESFRTLPLLSAVNTTFNGTEQPGVTLGRPANPDLQWETTQELDIGLSASFLKERLTVDVDYYNKRTKDLLLNRQIPRQTGFDSKLQNIGAIRNQGIDVSVTSVNVQNSDFQWTTTLNVSANRNKVLNLGGVSYIDLVTPTNQGGVGGRLIVGKTVPVFVGVDYLGTWKSQEEIDASGQQGQHVGGPHFQDTNGDGQVSIDDFHVLGDPQPDFYGGIDNTLSYRNFSLDFFFQGTYGNKIFNTLTQTAFFGRAGENKYRSVLKRWTPDNPTSNIPRAGTVASFSEIFNNSEEIEDGSYLRLKNIRLAYSLPAVQDRSYLKNFRSVTFYVSAQNLLLFSHFKLFDPETTRYGNGSNEYSNILAGFADGAYPYAKTYTVGVSLGL